MEPSVTFQIPTLPTVILFALTDSINPCAIGVLIFLLSTLVSLRSDPKRLLVVGAIYTLTVYIAYFLAGIGLLFFLQSLGLAQPIGIFVGFLIVILGLIEIKDFFWYGQGISLQVPTSQLGRIKKLAKKGTLPAIIGLGFLVAAVELPCTGGPYLAITYYLREVLKHFEFGAFTVGVQYLLLYNFIFVLPLIVIIGAVYAGAKLRGIKHWKEGSRKWMRLVTGISMVILGVLLILMAGNVITITPKL